MELWALRGRVFILKIYDVSQHGLVSRTSIGPLVADKRTFVYFSFIVLYISVCPLLFVSPLSLALSLTRGFAHHYGSDLDPITSTSTSTGL